MQKKQILADYYEEKGFINKSKRLKKSGFIPCWGFYGWYNPKSVGTDLYFDQTFFLDNYNKLYTTVKLYGNEKQGLGNGNTIYVTL